MEWKLPWDGRGHGMEMTVGWMWPWVDMAVGLMWPQDGRGHGLDVTVGLRRLWDGCGCRMGMDVVVVW